MKTKPTKTKLTPYIAQSICSRVESGVPVNAAAQAEGVSKNAVSAWMKRGKNHPGTEFGDFARRLKAASAKAHAELAEATYKAALKDGRLGLAVLKSREPEDWSEKTQEAAPTGVVVEIRQFGKSKDKDTSTEVK